MTCLTQKVAWGLAYLRMQWLFYLAASAASANDYLATMMSGFFGLWCKRHYRAVELVIVTLYMPTLKMPLTFTSISGVISEKFATYLVSAVVAVWRHI